MNFTLSLRMRVYLSILLCVFVVGMIGLMVLEQLPPLDAFYFLIVTIATVGYGDIHPVTPAGKILVMVIILTGVGCFVGVAANSIESMIDDRERKTRLEKLNMITGIFFLRQVQKFSKNSVSTILQSRTSARHFMLRITGRMRNLLM
jgi:voltage-gated potassium channel